MSDRDPNVKFDGNTWLSLRAGGVVVGAVAIFSAGMGWMAYQNENTLRREETAALALRVTAVESQWSAALRSITAIERDVSYLTRTFEAEQRRREAAGAGRD